MPAEDQGLSISYDGLINIATGKSRMETNWRNREIRWSELLKKLSETTRTAETYAAYMSSKKQRQDEIKDIGGFVGGYIKGGRRKADSVVNRSLIALDIDYGDRSIFEDFSLIYGNACALYTTHKHSPNAFRGRLIIPLDRLVFCDEYQAIARSVAGSLGIEAFDDTTFEPSRLMFWPSTSKDGEFLFDYIDGPWMRADDVLTEYCDWHDATQWPVSIRVGNSITREIKKQGDPLTKNGVIGAFCRTYTIQAAIETFLGDVYEPAAAPGRYTYKEGSTAAGLVIYEDKFAYSHHGTDPVKGKLCNAFDLVRNHLYGLKDEDSVENTPVNRLPSFQAMTDMCMADEGVRGLLAAERINQAKEDFADTDFANDDLENNEGDKWQVQLEIDKKGVVKNTLKNLILVLQNDPRLKSIVFNELSDSIEITGPVPWQNLSRWWRDADDAQLVSYVDKKYGNFSERNYNVAVTKVVDDRAYHPIRRYFAALPEWDGEPRVDTLFIKYLGAKDNDYIRAVTRKTLCAAVARINKPGIKFDCMPVLEGPQGIGKSTLISKLAKDWFNDSLKLSDTQDKTAAEKLQGYWILEIGELAGLRKAEMETLKGFLSSQNDVYRASYGRRVTPHPRQCVFIGTTNASGGYLRDPTGNRRFWPVKVPGGTDYHPWDITDEAVTQIWAEVIRLYKAGENLDLDGNLRDIAEAEQKAALETDEREGLIREYLDKKLPTNWGEMGIWDRRNFINGELAEKIEGVTVRDRVCPLEIWVECFGKAQGDIKYQDSAAINLILAKIPGWAKAEKTLKFSKYGPCRGWIRENSRGNI